MFGSSHFADWPAEVQARQFFANGGARLHVVRVDASGQLERWQATAVGGWSRET